MERIQLLEEHVINKIAAGEVVERPASVVKELIENSIDAGAKHIKIALKEGGKNEITITDDGRGIPPEDLPLAVLRHATSKIQELEHLFHVKSMGFRGEALSAIASVSRFQLSSRQARAEQGAQLQLEGGLEISRAPWHSSSAGTIVNIKDLFYNLPVRSKFLKSTTAEFTQCLELVQAFALAYPEITFQLTHNGKDKLDAFAVGGHEADCHTEKILRDRVRCILGPETESQLVFIQEENQYGRVVGLISPPGVEKATSKGMITFVNRRWVKDQTLRFGLLRGYQSHLLKGRYPQAILYFFCDPTLIDVNVHPAKTEVRFQYPAEVQGLLAHTVRQKLREGLWSTSSGEPALAVPPSSSFLLEKGNQLRSFPLDPSLPRYPSKEESLRENCAAGFSQEFLGESVTQFSPAPPSSQKEESGMRTFKVSPYGVMTPAFQLTPKAKEKTKSDILWEDLQYKGSFLRCYLFFEEPQRVLVVDQHAFHERIIFEQITQNKNLLKRSQPLLIPEAIELTPTQMSTIAEMEESLTDCGFSLKIRSHTTLEILAVPAVLSGKNFQLLFENLSQLGHVPQLNPVTDANLDLFATIACHSAVRAGEEMSDDDIKSLIKEARAVDFYHNCPHGRRVFRWFSKQEMGQWFDRP